MGLISLIIVGALGLYYVAHAMEGLPGFLQKAVAFLTQHLAKLTLWGLAYGVFAAFMTPIVVYNGSDLIVRLFANLMIIALALPYAIEQLAEKYPGKMDGAIMNELKSLISFVRNKEKLMGYIGLLASVLMFALLFR